MTNKFVQSLASILSSLRQRMRLTSDCYLNSEVELWSTFTCIVCTVWKNLLFLLSFAAPLSFQTYSIMYMALGCTQYLSCYTPQAKRMLKLTINESSRGMFLINVFFIVYLQKKFFFLCFYSKICLIGFNVCSSNHLMSLLLLFSS